MGFRRFLGCVSALCIITQVASAEVREAAPATATAPKHFVQLHTASSPTAVERWSSAVASAYLEKELRRNAITTNEKIAKRHSLKAFHADFNILSVRQTDNGVLCEYQMTVSNSRGKILTLLEGYARVRMPGEKMSPHSIPAHQDAALAATAGAVRKDLQRFLDNAGPLAQR